MQKQNSKKPILIIIALLVVGAGAYFYMSGDPTDTDPSFVPEGVSSESTIAGAQVLTLLNQVRIINIDSSFFGTAAYSSLVDHTVPIYEQGVGKSNPFTR